MEKVLDVYKRPYNENYPIVCMDESPKQLISTTRPGRKLQPGKEATVDCDYIRHGMCNVFMANEPLRGKRFVEVKEQKTKIDWADFVKRIADEWYAKAKKITLVMDNLKTHSTSSFYERFEPAEAKRIIDRFEFVYTPKHGSWLNMAEIELNVINGQCLNRHIDSIKEVQQEVAAWQKHRNNKNNKISWQFTAKDARIKLKKLYPSVYD
jgi:hypothetical protein